MNKKPSRYKPDYAGTRVNKASSSQPLNAGQVTWLITNQTEKTADTGLAAPSRSKNVPRGLSPQN